jgi:hypothetical protein
MEWLRMHWALWLAVGLVASSAVAWLTWGLVPFALYPLVVAAGVLAAWRITRRARARRP